MTTATLTLSRRGSFSNTLLGSFWGPRAALICREGLRKHTDVAAATITVEIVATDEDPGGNNVFDSTSDGRIEGITTQLDDDFKSWVRKQNRAGLTYLTVYEVE